MREGTVRGIGMLGPVLCEADLLWAWAMPGIWTLCVQRGLVGRELLDLRQEPVWSVVV